MIALIKSALERMAPRLLYFYQIRRLRKGEPEIRFLARLCKKTAISLDVGANLGLYSYHMLPHSSAVVAFEPLPEMQQRLKKHFGSRLSLFPVALSDHKGGCQIRLPKGSTSWATIEPKNTLSLSERATIVGYNVPVCRLDDYKFQNVGVIKIDVEGHEEAVLHGGLQTITHERPALIIEIKERHNPGAIGRIAALLSTLGYRGYFVDKKKMVSMEEFDPRRDQSIHNAGEVGKIGRYINNFIFLPNQRMEA
jgi:FkbM family methyltransferase